MKHWTATRSLGILIGACLFINITLATDAQQDSQHRKHAMAMPGMQMGHDTHTPASEVRTAMVTAWNAGEIDNLAALYTESAVIILPDGKLVTGRQSVREYFQHLTSRRSNVSLTSLGNDNSGDLQVDFGIFSESQPEAAEARHDSATPQQLEGKYLMVIKRIGSDWKVQEQVLVVTKEMR